MKVVVRLAIVIATLLVLCNVAFAQCTTLCYGVSYTYPDGYTENDHLYLYLCDNGYGFFYLYGGIGLPGCLDLFGGGPGWFNPNGNPMFGGNPSWSVWLAIFGIEPGGGYLQPMGAGGALLTGVLGEPGGDKVSVKGTKVAASNCPYPGPPLGNCFPPPTP